MKSPTAPKDLSAAARQWWEELNAEFEINDAAGRLLLETAVRAFDRMTSARDEVKKTGVLVQDRFGQARPNPLLNVERDARIALLSALKQLKLEIDVPQGK